MLLERLKHETRADHEAAERTFGMPGRVTDAVSYRALLRRLYGFYRPVEAQLAALPWAAVGFDWAERRKVPLLERDLADLGDARADLDALPRCGELPPLATVPQGLGCVYVLEGATLGGQVIARHLAALPGRAFFTSDGATVGPRWQAFRAFLTGYAAGRDEDDLILGSAHATFRTLTRWLADGADPC